LDALEVTGQEVLLQALFILRGMLAMHRNNGSEPF
jgi:hypothetical protein